MTGEVLDQMPDQVETQENRFGIWSNANSLYLDTKIITNFSVAQIIPLCAPENPCNLEAIRLRVCLAGGVFREVILDLNLGSLVRQILNQIPECRLLVKSAAGCLDAYILDLADQTRVQSRSAIYFRENGLHRLWTGQWVMVCGDEVLGDCGDIAVFIRAEVSALHLAWKPELDADEALEYQARAMEKDSQSVQIAYGYTMLCAFRSELMKRGFSTFPLLYVQGIQNYGKTVLVTQQCLLYDHKERTKVAAKLEPISSEKGLIAEISAFRDQVVLVDDMAKSSDASVERDRLKKMAGLIRYAANDSERRTATGSGGTMVQECKAGVAMTGEIPFTAASDLSRIIRVQLGSPLRGGRVDARSVAATAFRAWIQWFLPQADERFEELNRICEQAEPAEQARLQKTEILLNWVLTSFYRFAWERGQCSEAYYTSASRSVAHTVKALINAQAETIESVVQAVPQGNLSWYILRGYQKGAFRIVPRKKLKREDDCVLEDGALCVRLATLKDFLQTTPWGNLSKNAIGSRLEQEKAIPTIQSCGEKRRAQKRIFKCRYLELSLDALVKAAKCYV